MQRNKNRIPEDFKSIEEIQEFWDEHSTADYWDELDDVDLELSPELKAKLELKKLYRLLDFSDNQIEKIEFRAKQENLNCKQIIQQWILEHV